MSQENATSNTEPVSIPPLDVVKADVLKVIRDEIDRDVIGLVPHIVHMDAEIARELMNDLGMELPTIDESLAMMLPNPRSRRSVPTTGQGDIRQELHPNHA